MSGHNRAMTADDSAHFDVIVCGAGTAGLHAAALFARHGFSVALLDARSAEAAGPTWTNGVLAWQFQRAGLPDPATFVEHHQHHSVRMVSPDRHKIFRIASSPIVDVDMRALTAYQRTRLADAGVTVRWGTAAQTIESDPGTSRTRRITTNNPDVPTMSARLFVDATGMAATLRRKHPVLSEKCPPPSKDDICRAYQYTYAVADRDQAAAFIAANELSPGEAYTRLSPSNGYSVAVLRVDPALETAAVLVGTLAADSPLSGRDLLKMVEGEHPFLGPRLWGGGGDIPLGRTYATLGCGGVALVGDSANQVMAAHGSGIGFGLMAAKVLVEAVTRYDDIGSDQALHAYSSAYHREFGAILAGYDLFRRMSSRIGPTGVNRMIEADLMDAELALTGLRQELGTIPLHELPMRIRSLITNRDVARQLVPTLIRMQLARAAYRLYPATDPHRVDRWDRMSSVIVQRQITKTRRERSTAQNRSRFGAPRLKGSQR